MSYKFRKQIINIMPSVMLKTVNHLLGRVTKFSGLYSSWEQAQKHSIGYNSDIILDKVKSALLKVKNGNAVYERDSVLFNEIQYSWPLLAGLLWIASNNGNKLNLVDFGGALGSSYYQNRRFLVHLEELRWNIVEQLNFVKCGKQLFENEHVRFFNSIEECLKSQKPDTIILSGVLQYLEKPYDLLSQVINKGFKYLIFDRTPFLEKGDDCLTVQVVPQCIYKARYPAWFFNKSKFMRYFESDYECIAQFEALAGRIKLPGGTSALDMGMIFKRHT